MDDNNIQRSFDRLIAKIGEICSPGVNVPHYKEDCYWYGEWQDMNARIPYCKCKKYPADTIGPNDCESCKQYHSKYKPSKADSVRAMTDEELAKWIALHPCLPNCPAQTEECFKSSKSESCAKRWLDYLKEEVAND